MGQEIPLDFSIGNCPSSIVIILVGTCSQNFLLANTQGIFSYSRFFFIKQGKTRRKGSKD